MHYIRVCFFNGCGKGFLVILGKLNTRNKKREKKEKEGKHILIYLSSKLRENYYDLILKKWCEEKPPVNGYSNKCR